jgi:hypothetical protein
MRAGKAVSRFVGREASDLAKLYYPDRELTMNYEPGTANCEL